MGLWVKLRKLGRIIFEPYFEEISLWISVRIGADSAENGQNLHTFALAENGAVVEKVSSGLGCCAQSLLGPVALREPNVIDLNRAVCALRGVKIVVA